MPTRLNLVNEVKLVKSPAPGLGTGSQLPPRRRSLLVRRSSSRATQNTRPVDISKPLVSICVHRRRLPTEILEIIVAFYVEEALHCLRLGQESLPKTFTKFIKNLLIVSRDFRVLALKYLCETLRFTAVKEARQFVDYIKTSTASFTDRCTVSGFIWVKSLSTPGFLIPSIQDLLQYFTNLRNLHIDAGHSTLFSQQTTIAKLFDTLRTGNYPVRNITSFTITNLPRIDYHILELIANGLPAIEDLYLSTLEGLDVDCCGPCYEESLTRVNHSPILEAYPECENLAVTFGKALGKFKNLKRVYFGFFLSRLEVIERHNDHNPGSQNFASTFDSIADCSDCEKYEKETKRRELNVSLHIARCVDTLEVISWASTFVMGAPVNGKVPEDSFVEVDSSSQNAPRWNVVDASEDATRSKPATEVVIGQFQENNIPWRSRLSTIAAFKINRSLSKIRLTRMLSH
ncbi:hypothetical protein CPB83DRAFT_886955 [Crepidotus variabilis]|uniref:Uncharacterized protein n=1 Tax=Crepidotus variabilis TaxID=179855 RepID=A0A9P6E6F6_9AGAR|nr:hypothetical protein CPB83DRAFT_886955 [Crepidotus variabilis]